MIKDGPDFYPWNIRGHLDLNSDDIVHEFTHVWENHYIGFESPMHEFWATYLHSSHAYTRYGGEIEDYTLKSCKVCLGHGVYWDEEGNLTETAMQDDRWRPEYSYYFLAHSLQFDLGQIGFKHPDFREIAKILTDEKGQSRDAGEDGLGEIRRFLTAAEQVKSR